SATRCKPSQTRAPRTAKASRAELAVSRSVMDLICDRLKLSEQETSGRQIDLVLEFLLHRAELSEIGAGHPAIAELTFLAGEHQRNRLADGSQSRGRIGRGVIDRHGREITRRF